MSRLVLALAAAALFACYDNRDRGAPATGGVHPPGIADPRSSDFHGTSLRAQRWAPMLDSSNPAACGLCHAGSPAAVPGVAFPAPGATACTDCHTQAGGPLACSTCHGAPPNTGAHVVHVAPSAARSSGLPCGTCHPTPGNGVIGGAHGDGRVDVTFDPVLVASGGAFDRVTGTCNVSCHAAGARPRPAWSETNPMDCKDCHGAPPAGHFAGPCSNCHREANAAGTALSGGSLHLDGRVDLGDGSGQCGACHGRGDDPWPSTAAHPSHQSPTVTSPIACSDCHTVPPSVLPTPGTGSTHLDGVVEVTFSGRARARGAQPAWDGARCSAVACHGANLVEPPAVVPIWNDASGAAGTCGACHGIPPGQHSPSRSCDRATCHGSEITRDAAGSLGISPSGKLLHIDGVVDSGGP